MNILSVYLIYTAVVSLITIIFFASDKIKSKNEKRTRTPEAVLLSLISLGGACGGLVGIYAFRHKTCFSEKFQFAIGVWASFVFQVALGIFIALVQFDIVSFIK